jgi:histidine ammonia-lyase
VRFDRNRLTIEDIVDIAQGRAMPRCRTIRHSARDRSAAPISSTACCAKTARLRRDHRLRRFLHRDVPPELVAELPHHLYTYHGVRPRRIFHAGADARHPGVPPGIAEQRLFRRQRRAAAADRRLLDAGLLPLIPSEGSVGASGDLTPLSYLAAVLCGEREVWRDGVQVPAAQALQRSRHHAAAPAPEGRPGDHERHRRDDRAGLHGLRPRRVPDQTDHPHHGDGLVCAGRQRPPLRRSAVLGQAARRHAAGGGMAAQDLPTDQWERNGKRLQDRYSIRCAPHVIGVLADALPFFRSVDRK